MYGNTVKVANAIAGAFPASDVQVQRAVETSSIAQDTNLIIIGSPTQAGRQTKTLQDFLDKVSLSSNNIIKVAVFDTRLSTKLVGIFGYAADKIAGSLKKKGITLLVPPEGFIVKSAKGPLKEGELERATGWGKYLANKINNH